MVIVMKAKRRIIYAMEGESIFIMMEVTIWVIGSKVRWKGMDNSTIQMAI